MSAEELTSKAKEITALWWLAAVWFLLFTCAALGNSIITAFYGMRWKEMDWQDRIMIGILIFVNWATVMMAFFSRAISRVSRGQLPIQDGDGTRLLHNPNRSG